MSDVWADDEDCVVSGDGSDDFGPTFVVDSGCDWRSSSGSGDEDDEILGLSSLEGEVFEDVLNVEGVCGFLLGKVVACWAFGDVEFAHVAGERCLCDVKAALGEFEAKFILAWDSGADEIADSGLAFGLH